MNNLSSTARYLLFLLFALLVSQPALAGDRKPDSGYLGESKYSKSGAGSQAGDSKGNKGKVDICHVPPGNPANAHHIRVGSPASDPHRHNHGDDVETCDDDEPRGRDKVTICHIPPGNPANAHTITIGRPALSAHLDHGDVPGACDDGEQCPVVKPDRAWWKSVRSGGVNQYRQCLTDCRAPADDGGLGDSRDLDGDGLVTTAEKRQCRLDCRQQPPPLPLIDTGDGEFDTALWQCMQDCRIDDDSAWNFNRKGRFVKRHVKQCLYRCQQQVCDDPGENHPPVADAGPDQTVDIDAEVTLDGSASSDADGDPLTYLWTIAALPPGSGALLSDPTAVMPGFTADLEGEYLFDLVVNDGELDSPADQVSIVTFLQNTPPIADAGPDQSIAVGDTVMLDGSDSSDADADPLTFDWSFVALPAGSSASLSDPASVTPEFVADLAGQYILELVVDDGDAASDPDTVVISTVNTRPIADAGPDITASLGQPLLLSGAGSSDADGDPIGFAWTLTTRPEGSSAILTGADTVEPELVTDLAGVYVVQLIVNDGQLDSLPDTAVVRAVDNQSPTAVLTLRDLGGELLPNGRVPIGDDFLLDGSDSFDPEGDIVSYVWTYLETGVSIETDGPVIEASLLLEGDTLPLGGHVFQLQVTDTSGNLSEPSQANLVVFDPFPPTAVLTILDESGQPLTDGSVSAGEDFILDGSASSDGEGDIAEYQWTHVDSGLSIATDFPVIDVSLLMGGEPLNAGQQTFELQVTDESGNQSQPVQSSVIVIDDQAPTAVPRVLDTSGNPIDFVAFPSHFLLDGTNSFDIGGEIVTYSWTFVDTGAQAETDDPMLSSTTFTGTDFLPLGEYLFELVVTDDSGNLSVPAELLVVVGTDDD